MDVPNLTLESLNIIEQFFNDSIFRPFCESYIKQQNFLQITNEQKKSEQKIAHFSQSGEKKCFGRNCESKSKIEKKFKCKFCNKCFGYKHVLKNHERIHTGEKPFQCKECKKRFGQQGTLKRHLKMHNAMNEKKELNSITDNNQKRLMIFGRDYLNLGQAEFNNVFRCLYGSPFFKKTSTETQHISTNSTL